MPQHPPPLQARHLRRDCVHAAVSIPRHVNLTDTDPAVAGSRAVGPDAPTLGGLPEAALEERRAKRESGGTPSDRPTQPIVAVPAEVTADPAPPSRELALSIAHGYTAGHVQAGRAASEAMARFIRAQPDFVAAIRAMTYAELVAQRAVDAGDPVELRRALGAYADAKYRLVMLADCPSPLGDLSGAFQARIDEWLLCTVVVDRMRRRSEVPPKLALDRVANAERGLGTASSLDNRFRAELDDAIAGRMLGDVLQLDTPTTASNVTDLEILALARSFGDGTARDSDGRNSDGRNTCMIALGVCGPIPRRMEMIRGATREEVIAQARAWCVAKIHERAQAERLGADPDPVDGPERFRMPSGPLPVPTTRERNRARLARENAGLSMGQASRKLGMAITELSAIETGAISMHDGDAPLMAELYAVNEPWLRGEAPQHDYARVDAIRGSDKLTPGDRDIVAEFAAALPRDHRTVADHLRHPRSEHDGDGPCAACVDAAPRIFTPRNDGSCAVCGNPPRAHIERPGQIGACPAVAP